MAKGVKKTISNSKSTSSGIGIGTIGTILFLIFLVLKLTNHIDWSWWWVTAPLWIPLGLVIVLIAIVALVEIVKLIVKRNK